MNSYIHIYKQLFVNSWKYVSFRVHETKNLLLSVLGIQSNWQHDLIWQYNTTIEKTSFQPNEILDSLKDGFLWAVPVKRRTIERRLTRRLAPNKLYKLKKNLLVCTTCGHYHQAHTICGNCYEKVKLETETMQKAIQEELKLDPVDKEVLVVYENEKIDESILQGKRVVEIKKPPPQWFSRNLLTKARAPTLPDPILTDPSDKN